MSEGPKAKAVVVKKKVRPYPFEAALEANTIKKPVDVIFLDPKGLILSLRAGHFVSVGEYYTVIFELPVMKQFVNTQVRVFKTYDKAVDLKKHGVERLAELHFEKLTDEHRIRIASFIRAIGQR